MSNNKKKPYFSIAIPTYNRSSDLEFALERIFSQDFNDFEVVISDNNSTDDTQDVIKKFKGQNIKYYRNKENIGAVPNIKKIVDYCTGKYVLLHGDDDFMLYDNTLAEIHKHIVKGGYGLIRVNYLYQSLDKSEYFDYLRNKSVFKNTSINPHSSDSEVLDFIDRIDLFFISGIVYENILPKEIEIIDSELVPWLKIAHYVIKKHGGFYDNKVRFIASWSQQVNHPAYYMKEGRLPFEDYFNEVKKIGGDGYYKSTLHKHLLTSVTFFPSIKFNSNNRNVIQYAQRVAKLAPYMLKYPRFWIMLFAAILTPAIFLKFARLIYIKVVEYQNKQNSFSQIKKRVESIRYSQNMT